MFAIRPALLALSLVLSLSGCKKKLSEAEMEAVIQASLSKSQAEVAAKKKSEAAPAARRPEVARVRITNPGLKSTDSVELRTRELQLSGELGGVSLALPEDLTLELALRGAPGTAVKIGDGSLVLPASGEAKHRLDLRPPLLALVKGLSLKPGKIEFPRDLKIPVERSKDGVSERGFLRVDPRRLAILWTTFDTERARPLTLPGETAGSNQRASLLHNEILHFTHLGAPTSWENLDLVAIEYYDKMRTRGCGSYRNSAGSMLKLEIFLNDKTVKVYDRRTGKRVAIKKFVAAGSCPRSTRIGDSNRSFYADSDKITAWLAQQLKK